MNELQRMKETDDLQKAIKTAIQLKDEHLKTLLKHGAKTETIEGRECIVIPASSDD